MTDEQQTFYHLSVALGIGLLIGAERGWSERAAEEGARVAGLRTFGLIGLLGGASALLSQHLGPLVMALAFAGLAALLTTSYVTNLRRDPDVGITSLIAALLAYVYGALAVAGEVAAAVASAVVTAVLLSAKPMLHGWLGKLEASELRAALKLLLISAVVLPVLPNQGYGPWQALNPYAIWWMVVLIAAISFAGYFAVRIVGTARGIVFTSLFGGLASSTALTLHLSRLSRDGEVPVPLLATGILLACGTMFPRMLLVVTLLSPTLALEILVPVLLMASGVLTTAFLYWHSQRQTVTTTSSPLKNPLELKTALTFGLLLALVMLLVRALNTWLGDAGVLALALVSGVTDVDAITISLTQMSQDGLAPQLAATGILVAAASNSLAKGGMAAVIGGRRLGLLAGLPLAASATLGLTAVWL